MLIKMPVEVTLLKNSYVEVNADNMDDALALLVQGSYNTLHDDTVKSLGEYAYYQEAEQVEKIGD